VKRQGKATYTKHKTQTKETNHDAWMNANPKWKGVNGKWDEGDKWMQMQSGNATSGNAMAMSGWKGCDQWKLDNMNG